MDLAKCKTWPAIVGEIEWRFLSKDHAPAYFRLTHNGPFVRSFRTYYVFEVVSHHPI